MLLDTGAKYALPINTSTVKNHVKSHKKRVKPSANKKKILKKNLKRRNVCVKKSTKPKRFTQRKGKAEAF